MFEIQGIVICFISYNIFCNNVKKRTQEANRFINLSIVEQCVYTTASRNERDMLFILLAHYMKSRLLKIQK